MTLQRGTTYRGDLVGLPGPPLLGLGSIEPGGGFRPGHYKTFGGECPDKLMVRPGELYVALKGATKDGSMIGSVARFPKALEPGRLTQDTARLDFHSTDASTQRHLYWVLRTPQYRDYCAERATGTGAVALSRSDFLSFPLPPLSPAAIRIIDLLEAVDDKIELNRRMNETLESLARELTRSSASEASEPLATLAGINPDRVARQLEGELLYFDIGGVMRGNALPTRLQWSNAPSRAQRGISDGDTVLSMVRPDRGSYFFVVDPPKEAVASSGFAVVRALNPGMSAALYCWLTDGERLRHYGQVADGGAYPAMRPDRLQSLLVPLEFKRAQEIDQLLRLAAANRRESATLAHLRDTLLPELISGRIRVKEAEKLTEAAV